MNGWMEDGRMVDGKGEEGRTEGWKNRRGEGEGRTERRKNGRGEERRMNGWMEDGKDGDSNLPINIRFYNGSTGVSFVIDPRMNSGETSAKVKQKHSWLQTTLLLF